MDKRTVIDGAVAAITETGLKGLTLASVAARAGVSRASVYRMFGSRSALIDAVVTHELATMESILSARLRFSDDARATVTAIVREVLDYFDSHRALRAVLRHDSKDLLPFLIADDNGHPTLVDLVVNAGLPHITDSPIADQLYPDPPRAIEHMVRVLFSHLLIPSKSLDDKQVAEMVAAAVVKL